MRYGEIFTLPLNKYSCYAGESGKQRMSYEHDDTRAIDAGANWSGSSECLQRGTRRSTQALENVVLYYYYG